MDKLLHDFERYLRDTLQIAVAPQAWEDEPRLPFFLRDLYRFYRCTLLDAPCLLMAARDPAGQTPATVCKQMSQVQERWSGEVVYLCPEISAYNRKRLIEQGVPFVSPGNQMYLPMLGIDLREHFRRTRLAPVARLSPATQTVILHVLLMGDHESITTARLAKLGYSAMTLTRAFAELEALQLGEVVNSGRERVLSFPAGKEQLWQRAQEFMRSPVKKRASFRPPPEPWRGLPAGLSALAHYSRLAAPASPVYATDTQGWQLLQRQPGFELLPQPETGAAEMEIWSYSPVLFIQEWVVDRFSLCLSLRESTDERVQTALEQLLAEVTW